MCFTVAIEEDIFSINWGSRHVIIDSKNQFRFKPGYKIQAFTNDYLPVFKKPGELTFQSWGFIQPVVGDTKRDIEIKHMTGNAKGFEILDKPLYKKAVLTQRCVIAVKGFYEWRHVNKVAFPHFIYQKGKQFTLMGGIWNNFYNQETNETYETVSMLTTPANPTMKKIHNLKEAQPFLIDEDVAEKWLDQNLTRDEIAELIKIYPEEKMSYHTVGKKLDPDSPNSIKPVIYPELANEQTRLFD